MSTDPSPASRPLPEKPNLRHLRDEAKDLLRSGGAESLAAAQFQVARSYGFASWPKLKAHVDALTLAGRLKRAIDANDFESVKAMMSRDAWLHQAPLGYGKDGPLTWVAECRVPREPPKPERLAIASWMIENGSDVHQGGDGPLMRAALSGDRIPMMELLVAHGADVNAYWHGTFPIIFAACEAVDPAALRWLVEHGARTDYGPKGTALDYLIATYGRSSERLARCVDILLEAGASTKYDMPGLLDILRGRLDALTLRLEADATLATRRFPNLDCGSSGGRALTLRGATLLHVAAEFGNVEAARLLLASGAGVNAQAEVDETGSGGQTAIFHAATQFDDFGLPMVRLLVEHGADLTTRARLAGDYERPGEILECNPLEYALLFPGGENKTTRYLSAQAARQ